VDQGIADLASLRASLQTRQRVDFRAVVSRATEPQQVLSGLVTVGGAPKVATRKWQYDELSFVSQSFQARRIATMLKSLQVPVAELIRLGEGPRIEFKETARVNLATGQRDKIIELMVIKTIAGFMNAAGGTLLVGVADDGEVVGIKKDIKTLGSKQSRDGFALWLTGLLDSALGPTATANVSVSFDELADLLVCRIDVQRSRRPVFVRGAKGEADLYVRLNNGMRLLNTADALEYSNSHWH
jgi:ATP-dependent Lon protease